MTMYQKNKLWIPFWQCLIFCDVPEIPNRLTSSLYFLRLRFDCGSGVGTVRSTETVKLNEWNTLSVYRHRWDAWIQLNQEKRVEGRSKVRALHFISIKARSWILFPVYACVYTYIGTREFMCVYVCMYILQIQWGDRYSLARRIVYYRDYRWVYSNSRDIRDTRASPSRIPDVLCNGAIRNRSQLLVIIRCGNYSSK